MKAGSAGIQTVIIIIFVLVTTSILFANPQTVLMEKAVNIERAAKGLKTSLPSVHPAITAGAGGHLDESAASGMAHERLQTWPDAGRPRLGRPWRSGAPLEWSGAGEVVNQRLGEGGRGVKAENLPASGIRLQAIGEASLLSGED
jgi:hypothetical protein